jgi:hypothetical protein
MFQRQIVFFQLHSFRKDSPYLPTIFFASWWSYLFHKRGMVKCDCRGRYCTAIRIGRIQREEESAHEREEKKLQCNPGRPNKS